MNSQTGPQALRVPSVQFLGEQDGAPERLLKKRLAEFFMRDKDVQRAYLAQIRAGEHIGVALCIRTVSGSDGRFAQEIGAIFAAIFAAHEHLDILLLSDMQEALLKKVCSPFFSISTD